MEPLPTDYAPAERASEDQIRRDAELYAQDALASSMLDAIPDIVLVLNSERQIVFANEACRSLLNLSHRDEVLGLRPGEMIGCAHATTTEGGCGTTEFCRTCGAINAVLTSLKGRQSIQECRITLTNGSALDLRASAKPLVLGGRLFSVFVITDISGEKRRRALERIFFHDVLNTAGVVSTSAELMMRDPNSVEEMVGELYGAAYRLINEIRTQQELAAAENGDLNPYFKTFGAAQLLRELVEQFAHHEVAAGRKLVISTADEGVTVTTDRTLLGRVIGNMLKNALEAAQPGDTITAGYTVENNLITFSVHNPTVIPRNVQLQIFNRSFSTKGAGRGLGTYSMKLLSERYLGGCVRFESLPETGTTFYAVYPLRLVPPIMD
ncbi:MAG: GHKL domain-containing protein [Anaerolinea sp.]|nr:GHKL domain-containing protein [Anaerolinea sp.]